MQSAARRRARNEVLSAALLTPAELPPLEVDPSEPATRVTVTVMSVRILNFSRFYLSNTLLHVEIGERGALALKHEN
jgi:hypothetical protein